MSIATVEVPFPRGRTLRVLEHRAAAHDFREWERVAVEAILDYLRPGMVVYDVGAEEGEFSALWAQVVGPRNVHLFEPTPGVWPNIRAVWEANHDEAPGGLFAGFVARTRDARHPNPTMDDWPDFSCGALQLDSRFSVETERPDIPAISLDLWRDCLQVRHAESRVDAIVCDVEGAEVLVFDGAQSVLAGSRPEVFVSVHPDDFIERFPAPMRWQPGPCRREHLFSLFADLGYEATHISTDHEEHFRFTPRERA